MNENIKVLLKSIMKQEIILLVCSIFGFVSFFLLYDMHVGVKFGLYSFLGGQVIILLLMFRDLILFAIDAKKEKVERSEVER